MIKRLYIDIGSTNIKSMVCSDGVCGRVERVAFPPPAVSGGGRFEVDVSAIVGRVMPIVDAASADEVFLSVQMHGYILADARRRPVTRYISWQDCRAGAGGVRVGIGAESGTSMKANLPRAGVETIAREQPALYAAAAEFFTLGSYIACVLTGNNATHITDAAASGYYNVKERTAVPCGLRLPNALYRVAPVGVYRGGKVFAPMGDQQCAVLGAGGGEDALVLNLGTAAQMCTVAEGFVAGEFESRPYFGGKTLCTVTGLTGGKRLGEGCVGSEELGKEYAAAARRLPARKRLIVTGGAYAYHRALIDHAAAYLGLPYTVNEGADALGGLKIISEEQ